MLDFLSCLDFAIQHSAYKNFILKPKQVICLKSLFFGRDVLAILPTGFGKSLIFHLLPFLLSKKRQLAQDQQAVPASILVVSPLNSLIENQISRLRLAGVSVSILKAVETGDSDLNEDKEKLDCGMCDILFAHPEAILSSEFGRDLLHSEPYQKRIAAVVIDEAHCILEWSPGFGLSLVAETTKGALYNAEWASNPPGEEPSLPEELGKHAAELLLEEIYRGGCVDSSHQSLALLFMVLGQRDVSKIVTGPLSPYTIQFLRYLKDFFQVMFKIEVLQKDEEDDTQTGCENKVQLSCVGVGFTNISKSIT